jgi:hypothetical protein
LRSRFCPPRHVEPLEDGAHTIVCGDGLHLAWSTVMICPPFEMANAALLSMVAHLTTFIKPFGLAFDPSYRTTS